MESTHYSALLLLATLAHQSFKIAVLALVTGPLHILFLLGGFTPTYLLDSRARLF